jgi:hypothetical protein
MKKNQNMPAGLSKMILAQHFCTVAREECNKYDLTAAA